MKFNAKKLEKHSSLDEVIDEIYSPEEIKLINEAAEQRSLLRRRLADQVSKALAEYMAKESIGFNELDRRLQMSSATTAKLLKGEANLTLETIVSVSSIIGVIPNLTFSKAK